MSKLKLNIRPLSLKLKYPFSISRNTIHYANNVLVTLSYAEHVAFGESAPSVYYGEDQDTVRKYLNDFIKGKAIEEYVTNIKKLNNDLEYFSKNLFRRSCPSARAALDMAIWDLVGKLDNKPLYQFFFEDEPFLENGHKNKLPLTSYTIGLDDLLTVESKIKTALSSGYEILKIKLGNGMDYDLSVLNKVKELTADKKCKVRVDANGAWDLETTKKMFDVLPKYDIEFLEQPLPRGDIDELATIYSSSPVPIFVDEDCMASGDIESLAGKVHGINIKLMKCGGILEALNMINLARAYNLKVMIGCMIESSCAISAAVHLSPLADYVDLDGHLLLAEDPFTGLVLKNNKVIPSLEPGLGVALSTP